MTGVVRSTGETMESVLAGSAAHARRRSTQNRDAGGVRNGTLHIHECTRGVGLVARGLFVPPAV